MVTSTQRFLATFSLSLAILGCSEKEQSNTAVTSQPLVPPTRSATDQVKKDTRAIARKVFELGGSVNVIAEGKEYNFINKEDGLPQGDFTLTYVGFWHLKHIVDADIEFLRGMPELIGIGLDNTGITDVGLESYYDLKELRRIEIGGTNVTEKGVEALLLKHPETTEMTINDLPITDRIMSLIGRCNFIWAHRTKISDAGLAVFGGNEINTLLLDGTAITDEGLRNFAGAGIYNFGLTDTAITDTGLSYLSNMKRIDLLHLKGTKVTETGVAELQKVFPNCKIER
jgi:hypothetical protein